MHFKSIHFTYSLFVSITTISVDYGSEEESIHELEMGPHFLRHPESTVVVSEADKDSEPVHLECQAQANPPATYRWFKGRDSKTEITEALDIRSFDFFSVIHLHLQ